MGFGCFWTVGVDVECPAPSPWESFQEEYEMIPGSKGIYQIFILEPLPNLDLGMSKLGKESTIGILSLNKLRKNEDKQESESRQLCLMKNSLIRACNLILAAIEKENYAPGSHIGFLKMGRETQLNGLFGAEKKQGVLKGKKLDRKQGSGP